MKANFGVFFRIFSRAKNSFHAHFFHVRSQIFTGTTLKIFTAEEFSVLESII